jgi:hypothetical protein
MCDTEAVAKGVLAGYLWEGGGLYTKPACAKVRKETGVAT